MQKALRRNILLLGIIVFVILFAFRALAQDVDLSKTYTFPDGITFSYPQDLVLDESQFNPVILYNADPQLRLPKIVVETIAFDNTTYPTHDLVETLTAYFNNYFEGQIKFYVGSPDLERFEVNGNEAARYPYEGPQGERGLLIGVRLSDGSLGFVNELSDHVALQVALAIVRSLHRAGDMTPCTVSTSTANTVAVRVGPGTNRTTFAFLPAGKQFTVLGKAEADDGSQWWQLDKQEVAPKKSAAQAWISQLDVDSMGSCDQVIDANAPPIIPIVTAAPTQSTSNSATPLPAASASGTGTQPLTVRVICAPGKVYSGDFMISNPNPFEVPVSYVLSTKQSGFFFARPEGDTNHTVGLQQGQLEITITIDWGDGTAMASSRCGQTQP